MKKNTVGIAWFGVFTALALIFSYVETLIPFQIGIPGVKLGLANLIVVVALYKMGGKDALLLSVTFKPCSDGDFEKAGIIQCFWSQHGRWCLS